MPGYAFISNSTKPTEDEQKSREKIQLNNVEIPCVKAALEMGYTVFLGKNRFNPESIECDMPVNLFDSHTYRSVTAVSDNKIAYLNFSNIVEKNNIEVIHCNTPVGGLIGRIVGRKYHVNKIIYTAHGFHFYNGAPLINRTIYKWAEQIMAHWSDVIITMNEEDYIAAKKMHLRKGGKVYKVHGVGISLAEYNQIAVNREETRRELGLKNTDFLCISAGDIIKRKNYEVAIRAIDKVNIPNLHYIICGIGPERERLEALTKELGVDNQIHFLGYRKDIKELMKASDLFLFTSMQEGLPRSLMEAMALGLPVVVSSIRGNVDLIENGKGGLLFDPQDISGFAEGIRKLIVSPDTCRTMGEYNKEQIKQYDIGVVEKEIAQIYRENIVDYSHK